MLSRKNAILALSLSVALLFTSMAAYFNYNEIAAKGSGINIRNYYGPKNIYKGTPVYIAGTIKSNKKLKKVIVGVTDYKGKYINGINVKVNLNRKSFNISSVDSKIKFGKVKPGIHYYKVEAKDSSKFKTLVKKKFTVSYISGSKIRKPTSIKKGKGFFISGKVNSAIKLKTVKVGIADKNGDWKKGFNITEHPSSKNYNMLKADPKIKFGKLSKGTYRFKVWAKDTSGKSNTVVDKKFKVCDTSKPKYTSKKKNKKGTSATSNAKSRGKKLRYDKSLISRIGRQTKSGPCGLYSMAYARAVIDGKFTKGKKYKTYYDKLRRKYGMGRDWAHWYAAGGDSILYTSTKSCYKNIITQINKGRPCIMNMRNTLTGNNHYVTVIGYVNGTTFSNVSIKSFIFLDPVYACERYMKDAPNYKDSSNPQLIIF